MAQTVSAISAETAGKTERSATTVPDTSRVANMVSMAFRECHNGAFGPSFLEIPRDILDGSVPVEQATIPEAGRYRASTKSTGDKVTTSAAVPNGAARPLSIGGKL